MLHTLSFSTSNAKLPKDTATFSIPAGYTCPGAKDCHSWYNREEGKLYDGKHQEFRCFAAQMESYLPARRAVLDRNLRMLKSVGTVEGMATLINASLPDSRFPVIRVHVGGDFYSGDYFLAWMEVARRNPDHTFYAYTKSIPTWVRYRKLVPSNFALTASLGGKFDKMVEKHGLRTARVVFHPEEAEALGLEIDHDDSHARALNGKDFALLIHSTGPAGSKQNLAKSRMNKEKIPFAYSHKKKPAPGPSRSIRKL